jgi:mannose-6-phosphate isomerase-like protein (cupin superfamily)
MLYTLKNLNDVEDFAPKLGFGHVEEIRFPWRDLGAERTGLTYHRMKPNQHGAAHRHQEAEEIYIVLAGSGRMKLDADIVELKPHDAVRVAPQVARAFEAGDDGLDVIALGAHHEGDGEVLQGDPFESTAAR